MAMTNKLRMTAAVLVAGSAVLATSSVASAATVDTGRHTLASARKADVVSDRSERASITIKDNKGEIQIPAGVKVTVKAKTNSLFSQKVALTSKDGAVNYLFTGSGERNTAIGQETFTSPGQLSATFEYAKSDRAFKPSKLRSGGPYEIGSLNLMLIVAENGDDDDYNDTVLEFSWYTPK